MLDPKAPKLFIQPEDRITTETLLYKENKVFILGGVNPQIFSIKPENRETLADVLFTSGGPLGSNGAKRSEVYLLRGNNPVVAFHLDAQSPTRLIVADAMELRPNDILYVAEQPIVLLIALFQQLFLSEFYYATFKMKIFHKIKS